MCDMMCNLKNKTILNKNTLDNSPPPLLNLSENWLLATCTTNLNSKGKTFEVIVPQGNINEVKNEKSK